MSFVRGRVIPLQVGKILPPGLNHSSVKARGSDVLEPLRRRSASEEQQGECRQGSKYRRGGTAKLIHTQMDSSPERNSCPRETHAHHPTR
jgi:hypothetical protein